MAQNIRYRSDNLLTEGVIKDSDVLFQPKNSLRHVENMRIISNADNTFSLESIKGTILSFSLPNLNSRPIGWCSNGNDLIVFSTDVPSAPGGLGEIGKVTFNFQTGIGTYSALYSDVGLKFCWEHPIRKCRVNRETINREILYWTDDFNPPRAINLEGSLTDPVETLDWIPRKLLGQIILLKAIPGELFSGVYQYFYRLKTNSGIVTNFSYVSRGTHIVATGSTSDYQSYQGDESTTKSLKGIQIQISEIDTIYDIIEVGFCRASDYNIIEEIGIFSIENISGTTMTFDHQGNENLGLLTASEVNQILQSFLTVKDFSFIKNRNIIGNISTEPEIDIDLSGVTVELAEYLIPSDMRGFPGSASAPPLTGHDATPASSGMTAPGIIYPNGKYKVSSGTVTYNAILYNTGDVFTGVPTVYTFSGAGTVKAIIRIERFTGIYDDIIVENDWYDLKGMAVRKYLMSLWRGERYRIGFLPWSKPSGRPMFVRWIADIDIPQQYEVSGGIDFRLAEIEDTRISLRHIGLKISSLDLTAVADQISGFSIVIAPRDPKILNQGILFFTVRGGSNTYPQATPTLQQDHYFSLDNRRAFTYLYHSPDHLFQWNGAPNNFLENDKLKIVDYYKHSNGNGAMGGIETNDFHYYQKYATQTTGSTANGSECVIKSQRGIGFGVTISGYDPDDPTLTFVQQTQTAAGAVDDSAAGIGNKFARACQATILITDVDGFGDAVNTSSNNKAICNIIRSNVNQYGGNSDAAKANTVYRYAGHFQPLNSSVFVQNGNSWIFNDIHVFGGDCFVTLFDLGRTVYDNSQPDQISHTIVFPVESNTNTFLRQGRHLAKDGSFDLTGNPNPNGLSYDNPLQPENFIYNNGYSHEEALTLYSALPLNFVNNNIFDKRLYGSEPKVNGEIIDNFRRFRVNNFIELSGHGESLTNLRTKNDVLWYWQKKAMGYIPVHERVSVSTNLGQPLVVGTGGIMERFDERDSFYGNQHQEGLIEIPDGFHWFDMRRREWLFLQSGIQKLSTVKGWKTFFNDAFKNQILNDENPVFYQGISGVYDPRFEEVILHFLDNNNAFTVVYNILKQHFSGFFTYAPMLSIEHNGLILSTIGFANTIFDSTAYKVGDLVSELFSNYVCILAYTSGTPATQPSVDTTHWLKINIANQIWVHNKGDIAKIFGAVRKIIAEIIVNDQFALFKKFDNIRIQGNDKMFQDIYYNNSYQQASDLDADQLFEFRNRAWLFSIPLTDDSARLSDYYLQIRMEHPNFTTNPTISDNKLLKMSNITVFYRPHV